jgi:hypothetical protein
MRRGGEVRERERQKAGVHHQRARRRPRPRSIPFLSLSLSFPPRPYIFERQQFLLSLVLDHHFLRGGSGRERRRERKKVSEKCVRAPRPSISTLQSLSLAPCRAPPAHPHLVHDDLGLVFERPDELHFLLAQALQLKERKREREKKEVRMERNGKLRSTAATRSPRACSLSLSRARFHTLARVAFLTSTT